ncbi:Uncharacterised protein [Mycobacteroides abscessus subsp. abscessus]|nr:Uncharacterised protein [Mycobacteroides abscessus subsp. abscessus]
MITAEISSPEAMPSPHPRRMAAEITALAAHMVVGRVWWPWYQS